MNLGRTDRQDRVRPDQRQGQGKKGKKPAHGNAGAARHYQGEPADPLVLSSAASVPRRPPRVLTEAAVNGKVDPLEGLKENVIGRPADPGGQPAPRWPRSAKSPSSARQADPRRAARSRRTIVAGGLRKSNPWRCRRRNKARGGFTMFEKRPGEKGRPFFFS